MNSKPSLGLLLLVSGLGHLPMAHAGPILALEREPVRQFGYQLGDVISERFAMHLAAGASLDESSLPRAGKRASWFVVKAVDAQSRAYQDGSTRVDVQLDLQLVNSPTHARLLTIPPIAFSIKGRESVSETLPGLTIDAVPLDTGEVRTGLPDVRPLRPVPLLSNAQDDARLRNVAMAAAILAVWLALALAWRLLRPAAPKPFAAAQRELRRLLRGAPSRDDARLAVQRLHRAFDQTAGQRLFRGGVAAFCRRLGADAELERRTDDFFQASQTLFFAPASGSDAAAPMPSPELGRDLTELCRAWQRFEQRHR